MNTALISATDNRDIAELAEMMRDLGIEIFATEDNRSHIQKHFGYQSCKPADIELLPKFGELPRLNPDIIRAVTAQPDTPEMEYLQKIGIPPIDAVIVDMEPLNGSYNPQLGKVLLTQAAAANYKEILVIPTRADYHFLKWALRDCNGITSLNHRKRHAIRAFEVLYRHNKSAAERLSNGYKP
jgi:phosphoribosylaminoimidazolecarboxamide formyltransferase / IMP cyclohydrolase